MVMVVDPVTSRRSRAVFTESTMPAPLKKRASAEVSTAKASSSASKKGCCVASREPVNITLR